MKKFLLLVALLATAAMAQQQLRVSDEGVVKGMASQVNCTGAGVTCSVNPTGIVWTLNVPAAAGGNATPAGGNQTIQINNSGAFGAYGGAACAGGNVVTGLSSTGSLTCAAAGGGSPGGSNTQIQYNSSGSFAGNAGLTFDAANGWMAVAGIKNAVADTGTNSVFVIDNSVGLSGTRELLTLKNNGLKKAHFTPLGFLAFDQSGSQTVITAGDGASPMSIKLADALLTGNANGTPAYQWFSANAFRSTNANGTDALIIATPGARLNFTGAGGAAYMSSDGTDIISAVSLSAPTFKNTSGATVTVQDSVAAASPNTGIVLGSSVTRTSGKLMAVKNNGTDKFFVDPNGNITAAGNVSANGGTLVGNASTAGGISPAGTNTQFWRGDNVWATPAGGASSVGTGTFNYSDGAGGWGDSGVTWGTPGGISTMKIPGAWSEVSGTGNLQFYGYTGQFTNTNTSYINLNAGGTITVPGSSYITSGGGGHLVLKSDRYDGYAWDGAFVFDTWRSLGTTYLMRVQNYGTDKFLIAADGSVTAPNFNGNASTATVASAANSINSAASATDYWSGTNSWRPLPAGGGTPAGSNTYIQYNNNGAFGASSALAFTSSTNTLSVPNIESGPAYPTPPLILTSRAATGTGQPAMTFTAQGAWGGAVDPQFVFDDANGYRFLTITPDSNYHPVIKSFTTHEIKFASPVTFNNGITGSPVVVSNISATGTPSSTTFLRGDGSWNVPALTLDQIGNPAANKTFTMANKTLVFNYTAPVGADGAFEIDATGGFSGDLLHVHQRIGNPGAGTDLIHAEFSSANVTGMRITGPSSSAVAVNQIGSSYINGDVTANNFVGNASTAAALNSSASATDYWSGTNSWRPLPASSGSPGGANTQVQWNNAGAFAGTSSFTWTNSTGTLTAPNFYSPSGTLDIGGTSYLRGQAQLLGGWIAEDGVIYDYSGPGLAQSKITVSGIDATAGAVVQNSGRLVLRASTWETTTPGPYVSDLGFEFRPTTRTAATGVITAGAWHFLNASGTSVANINYSGAFSGTAAGLSTALAVTSGGLNKTAATSIGAIPVGSSTTAYTDLAPGAAGTVFVGTGTGASPKYLAAGTAGQVLSSRAAADPVWVGVQTCTTSASTTCTITVARSGCTPVCSQTTSVSAYLSRASVSATTLTCTFPTSGTNTCACICP